MRFPGLRQQGPFILPAYGACDCCSAQIWSGVGRPGLISTARRRRFSRALPADLPYPHSFSYLLIKWSDTEEPLSVNMPERICKWLVCLWRRSNQEGPNLAVVYAILLLVFVCPRKLLHQRPQCFQQWLIAHVSASRMVWSPKWGRRWPGQRGQQLADGTLCVFVGGVVTEGEGFKCSTLW